MKDDASIQPLRGFRELTPEEFGKKAIVTSKAKELFRLYGYEEVEIPTLEPLNLIELKVGEEIKHRMFRFKDLSGRDVVLRPEGTISIARLMATKLKAISLPTRLSYVANMFRYDEPQRGRFREHTQVGFELFGSGSVLAEVEILEIALRLLRQLGFKDFRVKIGHEGILRKTMSHFDVPPDKQDMLLGMLDRNEWDPIKSELRQQEKIELLGLLERLSGLKGSEAEAIVNEAKEVLKGIDGIEPLFDAFRQIIGFLHANTGNRVVVDMGFARGLEYYTGMIFEIYVKGLEIAVAGGGRYDGLCKLFGLDIPAIGFALGVDRLVLGDEAPEAYKEAFVSLVPVTEANYEYAFEVGNELRKKGIPVITEFPAKSLSSTMEKASKKGPKFAIIIGDKEASTKTVTIKDMRSGVQEVCTIDVAVRKICG
mgnify:CR=1 FL=1